jgi:hypothetical protein
VWVPPEVACRSGLRSMAPLPTQHDWRVNYYIRLLLHPSGGLKCAPEPPTELEHRVLLILSVAIRHTLVDIYLTN